MMELDYLRLVLLLLKVGGGYFLNMKTEGQVIILNEGDDAFLDCDYHADQYNLFDYPVLWIKSQRSEETKINIMGNINAPYVSSRRLTVKFKSTPPTYRLSLDIRAVTLEDSGNYTCEVRGPHSEKIGSVTHYVFVRAPIQSMKIVLENGTGLLRLSHHNGHSILSVTEGEPCSLRCVADGGYPPPNIAMYIDDEDITRDFDFEHTARMTGKRGLRVMHYVTERYTDQFIAEAKDDNRRLKCLTQVPGLVANMSYVRLSVQYSPKIRCFPTGAYLGDKNVKLRCEVLSKPRVSALFWIIDVNGTTITNGEVINEYWTLVRDRNNNNNDGVLETELFLREAKQGSFHPYTLVAENSVAVTTYDVDLYQKKRATAKQPLSHSSKTDKNTVVRTKPGGSQREGHVGYSFNTHSEAPQSSSHHYLVVAGLLLLLAVAV